MPAPQPGVRDWGSAPRERQWLDDSRLAAPLIPRLGKGPDKSSLLLWSAEPLPGRSTELPTHLRTRVQAVLHTPTHAHSCQLISYLCWELQRKLIVFYL